MLKISRKPFFHIVEKKIKKEKHVSEVKTRRLESTRSLPELNQGKQIMGTSLLLCTTASKEGEKGSYLHTEV